MIGAALVTVSSEASATSSAPLVGNFLVLAGTLFAAVYVVLSSKFLADTAPLPLVALQQSMGLLFALLLLAIALLTGWEQIPNMLSLHTMALALGSGVIQYALPFWLYLAGMSVLRTSTSALFLALIPVFGVAGAVLFLGETILPRQLLGCAIVIIAVAMSARRTV
jgi:drug/metabolite transporter (DMT)-like permease